MARARLLVVLATSLAVAVSLPLAEAMAAGGGSAPSADAAKKKRNKRCKRVKRKRNGKTRYVRKCKKRNTAKAKARRLIRGSEWHRPYPGGNYASGQETYRFCKNRRFVQRYSSTSAFGAEDQFGAGSWRLVDAEWSTEAGTRYLVAGLHVTGMLSSEPVDGRLTFAWVRGRYKNAGIDPGDGEREYVRRARTGSC